MKIYQLYHEPEDDNTDSDVFWIGVPDDFEIVPNGKDVAVQHILPDWNHLKMELNAPAGTDALVIKAA